METNSIINSKQCSLDKIESNKKMRILNINIFEKKFFIKLSDMGFIVGAIVEKKMQAPFGDPIIVNLHGYSLAIKKSLLKNIIVGEIK